MGFVLKQGDGWQYWVEGTRAGEVTLEYEFPESGEYREAHRPPGCGSADCITLNFDWSSADFSSIEAGTLTIQVVKVELKEVSFGGDKYWELKSDDGNTHYNAPQWKDVDGNMNPTNTGQGERDYAMAFTRATKPKIGAKFRIANASTLGAIKIKAAGPGGMSIPESAATVFDDHVTLPLAEASSALVNTIKFYDKKDESKAFKLQWQVKVGNLDWFTVGTTKHTVYLTLMDPATHPRLRQETLFELGCRNADGVSDQVSARERIYGEFTDQEVRRLDGKQMTYWKYIESAWQYTESDQILANPSADGNCQAWSALFRDVLRLQGIEANRMMVFSKDRREYVLVKNWTFYGSGTSGVVNYPFVSGVDAFPSIRIPAQGNSNSPRHFNGHWITESAGVYYDPSYGTAPVAGANKDKVYEDGAFDGFGLPRMSDSDLIRKNDTSSLGLVEVNYTLDN